ncbi:hypothetical protein K0M31_013000 [Melipona bicolor]|uniref:Uncharacterized protein n=1 Tax=Melipona bicolor TaxID=60889 RepID=A0AA40FJU8_9HYME|nr:hypothetical protein K0M31_013000 [Melipona bicolor]
MVLGQVMDSSMKSNGFESRKGSKLLDTEGKLPARLYDGSVNEEGYSSEDLAGMAKGESIVQGVVHGRTEDQSRTSSMLNTLIFRQILTTSWRCLIRSLDSKYWRKIMEEGISKLIAIRGCTQLLETVAPSGKNDSALSDTQNKSFDWEIASVSASRRAKLLSNGAETNGSSRSNVVRHG